MKYFLIVFTLMAATITWGKSGPEKHLNFIIEIDNDIPVGTINQVAINLHNDKNSKPIKAGYYPGDLIISESDYKRIIDSSDESIDLSLTYYRVSDTTSINYKVEISKSLLANRYIIIRIYNTEQGPYQGIYKPLDKGRTYTFELYSPDQTFTRVKLK